MNEIDDPQFEPDSQYHRDTPCPIARHLGNQKSGQLADQKLTEEVPIEIAVATTPPMTDVRNGTGQLRQHTPTARKGKSEVSLTSGLQASSKNLHVEET